MKGLTGWAKCPGTCGEWVQGAKNGIPFLIGCPINRFVEARAELYILEPMEKENCPHQAKAKDWLWLLPPRKEKTRLALEKFANRLNLPSFRAKVQLQSELQIGKGMASSTADMVAAIGAVAQAFAFSWEPEELARLVLEIEPTDPLMFEGVTEFAHRDGSYIKRLGPQIPAQLLMIDWGGSLDTQVFNARWDLMEHYRRNEQAISHALALFYEGIEQEDLEKIAQAATISARCNQEVNPKPLFEIFLAWILAKGGLGVIAAHSGTLLAGVFPESISLAEQNLILKEGHLRFRSEILEWVRTYDRGLEGEVKYARRQYTHSNGTVWERKVY